MKIVKTGQDARDALKRGIDLVANCAKPTLGNAGKAAILGRQNLPPKIADDAVSIALNLESEDPFENEAIKMVQAALQDTSKEVGDSTATTITLIQALNDAMFTRLKPVQSSLMQAGKINTVKLKKELDGLCGEVIEKLKANARPITKEEIYKIALTAGTYEWIAKIVAEVYEKVGATGYVAVEEGVKTEYEVLPGIELNTGYHSEYYVNSEDKKCVLNNVPIFVSNNPLDKDAVSKIVGLLNQMKIKKVILVAPDFTRDVLASMAKSVNDEEPYQFTAVALKLPTFDKNDALLDIIAMTGGKLMDKSTFIDYKSFVEAINGDYLGIVEQATIGDSKTLLVGGKGNPSDRIKELQTIRENTASIYDKDLLEKRIASLSGGKAVIKIGGYADGELGYFKLKMENAVASVHNALNGGVVPGGGVALRDIALEMPKSIITEALQAPYKQIQENNGEPFDVSTDINDAVLNTIGALNSARSLVGNVLMTETVTSIKNEPKDKDENY